MAEESNAGADRSPRNGHGRGRAGAARDPAPALPSQSRPLGNIHDRVRRIAERFDDPSGAPIARRAGSSSRRSHVTADQSFGSLGGLRLLMTVACPPDDDMCGDLAFQNALSTAGELFSHGAETVLVAVGGEPDEARVLAVRRTPGVSFWPEALPATSCGDDLSDIAERAGADMLLVQDAALAPTRRGVRPTIVSCGASSLVSWTILHGASAPPDHVRASGSIELQGLLAADRVVTSSRWLAEALADVHELPFRPLVAASLHVEALLSRSSPAPSVARPSRLLLTAGRLHDEALDLKTLDRAAACLDDSVMAAGSTIGHEGHAASFDHLQVLGGLRWPEIDRLLTDAPVFVSTALVPDPGSLLLRAAAYGCPLILSDIPAHRESWRGAAVFVRPGDHQGFAAAMRRASEDDEHRTAMSETARRRVRLLGAMRRSEALHEVLTSLSGGMRLTAAE